MDLGLDTKVEMVVVWDGDVGVELLEMELSLLSKRDETMQMGRRMVLLL